MWQTAITLRVQAEGMKGLGHSEPQVQGLPPKSLTLLLLLLFWETFIYALSLTMPWWHKD